jgi:toxin ParE1/3/4
MKVTLHPSAERDLREAAQFYEREGTPALAARFVAEFKRLASVTVAHPEIGAPRSKSRRGFAMNTFPYSVIYRVESDEIKVMVIKHDRKHPGFGEQRS